jgi:hypothetical protein
MRLKRGQATYKLKPFHDIVEVSVAVKGNLYRLYRDSAVGPTEGPPGRPERFVVSHEGEITFDRQPDKAYRVEIIYLPPMRTM